MNRSMLFFVLLTNFGFCFAQEKPEAAWLIHPSKNDGYGIEIWKSESSKTGFIWRLVKSPNEILAQVDEPRLAKDYSYNQGQCKIDGEWRDDVIVVVKLSEKREYSSEISKIWVALPEKKQFSILQFKSAECRNEGYGI